MNEPIARALYKDDREFIMGHSIAAMEEAEKDISSIEDWYRDYSPDKLSNECCFRCQHSAGSCEWSRAGLSIPGWITIRTDGARVGEGTKIIFCPEFLREEHLVRSSCGEALE